MKDTHPVYALYRPDSHGTNVSAFMHKFTEYLISRMSEPHDVIICGDINFHLDLKEDTSTHNSISLLDKCGLNQIVHQLTHSNGHILDPATVPDVKLVLTTPMIRNDHISDYYMIA